MNVMAKKKWIREQGMKADNSHFSLDASQFLTFMNNLMGNRADVKVNCCLAFVGSRMLAFLPCSFLSQRAPPSMLASVSRIRANLPFFVRILLPIIICPSFWMADALLQNIMREIHRESGGNSYKVRSLPLQQAVDGGAGGVVECEAALPALTRIGRRSDFLPASSFSPRILSDDYLQEKALELIRSTTEDRQASTLSFCDAAR
eukprot:757916-Hanusia_phi.AAC.3